MIEKNWPFATTIRPVIMPAMPTVALRSTASPEAEAFVRAFAAMWDRPTVEGFAALMHPEVRLLQPLAPPARGVREACEWFAGTLALLPDIRIAVEHWSGTPDALFIEWTATATFAGKPVRWSAVDRFRLGEGKVLERIAYFDPLPLLGAVLARPSGWLRFVRSRLGSRGRSTARAA
jgi:ketosteroid isomerase-like protein